MADSGTGRRYYHGKEPATPMPPPVPSHRSQLSRVAALQNEPQHIIPESGVAGDEEVSITMDDAAQELEEYAVEEENEEPHFAMSFEYEETFRAHKAASVSEAFAVVLKTAYQWTVFGVYHFFVIVTGLFIVLFWATVNGLTIYTQSWCLSPITRYIMVCLQGMCLPAYEIIKSAMSSINELMGTLTKGCCRRRP